MNAAPADRRPAAIFTYHHAYPETIFLVDAVASRRLATRVLVPLLSEFPERNLAIAQRPGWYPGIDTIAVETERRLLMRRAEGKRIIVHEHVRTKSDVEMLERLAGEKCIVIAVLADPTTDVQFAWSALCGDHRTYVISSMTDAVKQYYSVTNVADILGCTVRSVHNLIKRGDIPASFIGGKYYIPIAEFHETIQAKANESHDARDLQIALADVTD